MENKNYGFIGKILSFENIELDKINEITEKWDKFGFLFNVKNKKNAALACETCAFNLINNKDKYNDRLETLVFPVIIRTFRNIEDDLSNNVIITNVFNIISEFNNDLNSFDNNDFLIIEDAVYIEAELVYKFSENYKVSL